MTGEVEGYPGLTDVSPEDDLSRLQRGHAWGTLSAGARWALSRRLGRRPIPGPAAAGGPPALAAPAADLFSDDTPPNVRVNDPGEDSASGERTTQDRPSLVVDGRNVVVVFDDSSDASTYAGIARSADGGASFVDGGALADALIGDPVLADDGAGNLYVAANTFFPDLMVNGRGNGLGVARSTDGGTTFGAMVNANSIAPGSEPIIDRNRLVADRANGNLYLVWSEYVLVPITPQVGTLSGSHILFARSTDRGVTWSPPTGLSPPGDTTFHLGPVPAVAPDGTVYVTWFDETASQILVARSVDGGLTFANPVAGGGAVASTGLFGNVGLKGGGAARSLPDLTIDPKGNLSLAYPAWVVGGRADIFLVRSTDMGRTWGTPVPVSDAGTDSDQWLPAVAVSANGVVGVMFYDRRNGPGLGSTDVYLGQSFDGGASFLPNRRVTSVSFPPTPHFDPNPTTFAEDDRNQMAADGNRFAMVWADNRDLVGTRNDPNVYFARQDACQLYRDEVDEIDQEIATLEDAIDSGAILASQAAAVRRVIKRLGVQRQREEATLARCRG